MTQFKEKSEGQESVSVDLFAYPVLMAADILLYRADRVPVGDDQRQHLELARNIAQRFNNRFGELFPVPEAAIPRRGRAVMDLQEPTRKMSTTNGTPQGTVLLTDPPEVVAKKMRSAVTDSGREVRRGEGKEGIANLIGILAVATDRTPEQIEADVRRRRLRPVQGRRRGRRRRVAAAHARALSGAARRRVGAALGARARRRAGAIRRRARRSPRCATAWASASAR